MKLAELEPEFLKIMDERTYRRADVKFEEADGLWLLCPKCFNEEPVGPSGTHGIICWQPYVPQTMSPRPGRWKLVGTGMHDLTLIGQPTSSVRLLAGCEAHFSVVNGEIVWH